MPISDLFLTLGCLLCAGLICALLGQRTPLPRVTLLLLCGILAGRHGLDWLPEAAYAWFDVVAEATLLVVGFILGGKLTWQRFKTSGKAILLISVVAALVTSGTVFCGLLILGLEPIPALLLGCIASATAPAAVLDITIEHRRQSRFQSLLLSIVTLDDLWALILFSIGMTLAQSLAEHNSTWDSMLIAAKELTGAVVLGTALGTVTLAVCRIRLPKPVILTAVTGLIFICGGTALWWQVSFLLSVMIMGATLVNLQPAETAQPFAGMARIEWPLVVVFFTLAGASLSLDSLRDLSTVGLIYLLCRLSGKIAGGWLGSVMAGTSRQTRRWIGIALLPQAGVAIGMALLAAAQFPAYRELLLSVVIGSTVAFELFGPVLTRLAIRKTRHTDPQEY